MTNHASITKNTNGTFTTIVALGAGHGRYTEDERGATWTYAQENGWTATREGNSYSPNFRFTHSDGRFIVAEYTNCDADATLIRAQGIMGDAMNWQELADMLRDDTHEGRIW